MGWDLDNDGKDEGEVKKDDWRYVSVAECYDDKKW